jgi:hypothetical protein
MKKSYKRGLLLSTLTTASLVVASHGYAALTGTHPDVTLKRYNNGVQSAALETGGLSGSVAIGQGEAYSPRATCSGCHSEVVDENSDAAARTDGYRDPVTGALKAPGGYHGGGATKTVVKTQGVENQATGEIEWLSFNTKAYKHGFVTGRHSQQGRNEDFGHYARGKFGSKYWENSSGMFGKY